MNMTSHYSTTIKKLSHYSKTEQIQTATIDTLLLYYQAIILLWKKAARSLCYYTSTVVFMYTKEAHGCLLSPAIQPVYTQVHAS